MFFFGSRRIMGDWNTRLSSVRGCGRYPRSFHSSVLPEPHPPSIPRDIRMNFRSVASLAAFAVLAASCSRETRTPVAPDTAISVLPTAMSVGLPTVYTSGVSPVTTYDPIFPAVADLTWPTTSCTTIPAVGLNANWVNPHGAYDVGSHPWLNSLFSAKWINAWNYLASQGPGGQSWTKYTTPISGVGTYVLQLLADNCSWVYVDNQLVGVQPEAWNASNTTYSVTLDGSPQTLTFLIFDGGGAAGGKFRVETYDSYIANGGKPNLIAKTPTATTVSFGPGPFVYTGSALTATATVSSGATATIVYTGDCLNAGGTCTATATYAGDATHTGSTGTASVTIAPKTATATTVTFGNGPFVYTGSAFTATSTVTPAGNATIAYTGDCVNAGSTCAATATYAGDAGNAGSSATASITIVKAASATTVSFGNGPFVYTGAAFTATSSVTPVGNATIVYAGDCVNAGSTCTATATYAGNAGNAGSSATASITIVKAASATTVSFGNGPFVYTGAAFTATSSVTPAGTAIITYPGDCTNAGSSCSATASYAGDANHTGSSATASITIAKAGSATNVSFGTGPFVYRGSPFMATASVSPAAAGTATVSYSGNCANAGNTCQATATFAGSANFVSSSASASITIDKAPTTTSVTFGPGPFIYTGSPFTATASVNPSAAGFAAVSYSGDCTNAGNSCQATATFASTANFSSSTASTSIVIKLPVATLSGQCKQGGWQFLTDDLGNLFKNQGDCVSYVATKGKNKGAGGTP
jgi:hypothetical protein